MTPDTNKPIDVDEESRIIHYTTQAMRTADGLFVTAGGSTRHYVRDCFLPELEKLGYKIVAIEKEISTNDTQ